MAIKEFSTADLNTISRTNSVSNVLEKINGVTVGDGFTGLLDTYTGAAAGYSVRQLKTGVTVAMRVRRDTAGGTGDDDEADVAFDTSLTDPTISLDSAISNTTSSASTLGEFLNVGTVSPYNGGSAFNNPDNLVGAAEAYVDAWYDQSGNQNHAEQTAPQFQPQIHSGTVDTDLIKENGKPALQYDGSDDFLTVPNDRASFKFMHDGSFATIEGVARFGNSSNPNAAYTLFDTGGLDSTLRGAGLAYDDRSAFSRNNQILLLVSRAVSGDSNRPVFIQTNDKITPNQQTLVYVTIDADNATADDRAKYAISGGTLFGGNTNTVTPVTTDSDVDLHLGRYSKSNILQLLGTMQELVLWDADHSASRSGIESNIDTYFSIP